MKTFLFLAFLVVAGYAAYLAWEAYQRDTREAKTVKSLPPTAQHVVAQMDPLTQAAFFNEYEKRRFKTFLAYIFWVCCGAHYLYLKQLPMQIAFWVTGGGLGIWWIYNLFFMRSQVNKANEQIARECLQTLSIGAQFSQATYLSATDRLVTGQHGQGIQPGHQPAGLISPQPNALPPAAAPAPQPHAAPQAAAGWMADPHGRNELRYWDGSRWTEHVQNGGDVTSDPV